MMLDTKEKVEMTYNETIKYLADDNIKFKVDSTVMDDLIDTAIAYEDEQSMYDDYLDTADNFLNGFIKEDYHSIFDIMRFVTFYGKPYEMQQLIESSKFITYKN